VLIENKRSFFSLVKKMQKCEKYNNLQMTYTHDYEISEGCITVVSSVNYVTLNWMSITTPKCLLGHLILSYNKLIWKSSLSPN